MISQPETDCEYYHYSFNDFYIRVHLTFYYFSAGRLGAFSMNMNIHYDEVSEIGWIIRASNRAYQVKVSSRIIRVPVQNLNIICSCLKKYFECDVF